jgi:hypothetical protein
MKINSLIQNIRAGFATALPGLNLYWQLAPDDADIPYCVMRIGSISAGEHALGEREWIVTATFYLFDVTDDRITTHVDRLTAAFDQSQIPNIFMALIQSAEIDMNYTTQGTFWQAKIDLSFHYTQTIL